MDLGTRSIFKKLIETYGYQYWWPADSPLRVIIGAVLTQNAKWSVVQSTMDKLKKLSDDEILKLSEEEIATMIQSVPYAKRKARYLKELFIFYEKTEVYLSSSREELLEVLGVGPETADSIMLYAYNSHTIPIDFYTIRFLSRYTGIPFTSKDYEKLRLLFSKELSKMELMEFHALIVEHSKVLCKKKPDCNLCPFTSCNLKNGPATN